MYKRCIIYSFTMMTSLMMAVFCFAFLNLQFYNYSHVTHIFCYVCVRSFPFLPEMLCYWGWEEGFPLVDVFSISIAAPVLLIGGSLELLLAAFPGTVHPNNSTLDIPLARVFSNTHSGSEVYRMNGSWGRIDRQTDRKRGTDRLFLF